MYSRKASERSSSWTLSDGHFPLKMLSNTVAGPAPSLSDDATKRAAAAFAAATSSDMFLSLELNSLLSRTKFIRRCEIAVMGVKAEVYPRPRSLGDADAESNREMTFPLFKNGEIISDVSRNHKRNKRSAITALPHK